MFAYSIEENLHTGIITENHEFEVLVLEVDELWSFIGNKTKVSGEALTTKLPSDLKKSALSYR